MDLMREFPDNHFDLAVVDPPYGIGESGKTNGSRSKIATSKEYGEFSGCDKESPSRDYFSELRRVSKDQVVWGGNHMMSEIAESSPCWIVWDKQNGANDFADCELAWTSFKSAVRKVTFRWHGMLQGDMKNKESRIHPTQKPVALYNWIYANYAEKGMTILDTHLGSMSSAIAAHYAGMHLTGSELDPDYYKAGCERVEIETRQTTFL